jgi:hypothetical protein
MDARKKSTDPAAIVILNNVKVSRTGQRIQAVISMPRQKASDALADTMEKGKELRPNLSRLNQGPTKMSRPSLKM